MCLPWPLLHVAISNGSCDHMVQKHLKGHGWTALIRCVNPMTQTTSRGGFVGQNHVPERLNSIQFYVLTHTYTAASPAEQDF